MPASFPPPVAWHPESLRKPLGSRQGKTIELQWGRDLSVAETRLPEDPDVRVHLASMGPRPFSRGDVPYLPYRGAQTGASMGPRPFSRGDMLAIVCLQQSVNTLQWGRDLSVAETSYLAATVTRQSVASMGPRPFSRGDHRGRARGQLPAAASMGPRPFSRGDWGREGGNRPAAAASMGPRPFSRGDQVCCLRAGSHQVSLQWGRDLSVAETSGTPHTRRPLSLLQWGRDLSVAETTSGAQARGSTGSCFNGAATFQSRRPYRDFAQTDLQELLQWGRDLSVAETSASCRTTT